MQPLMLPLLSGKTGVASESSPKFLRKLHPGAKLSSGFDSLHGLAVLHLRCKARERGGGASERINDCIENRFDEGPQVDK